MKLWALVFALNDPTAADTLLGHTFASLPDCLAYEWAMEPLQPEYVEYSSCELLEE